MARGKGRALGRLQPISAREAPQSRGGGRRADKMAAADGDDSLYPIAVLIDELRNEDVQVPAGGPSVPLPPGPALGPPGPVWTVRAPPPPLGPPRNGGGRLGAP